MQIFRSRFGQVITWLVGLIMLLALVATGLQSGFWSIAVSIAPAALAVFITWMLFYNPRVEVTEAGVRLINVFREVFISWGAIDRIDTRWALTIYSGASKYSAWGAVAPGRHTALFATKDEGSHLPESTYLAGTVRPGDLITTDSGAAAAEIRRAWEKTRGQKLVSEVKIKWHSGAIITLSILIGMTVASL
jgi:hypothetical protein